MDRIGLVVIGRNEGERLRRCLESARGHVGRAVYVDSGSTDGSRELAREMGIEVVELDTRGGFTAARARNAGVKRLLEAAPDVEFVQFADGDCELVGTWWDVAARRLGAEDELAVVCGRRRERFRDATVYNRLCDMEWDTPVGPALACGGDAMMRVAAFQRAGGFNEGLIAGEEPELCVRLRGAGWRIERLDADMTIHDAAMHRVGQWWRREMRAGYAAAEGAAMHGHLSERYRVHMQWSNWLWGMVIPLIAVVPAYWTYGASLGLLLLYPVQWARIGWFIRQSRGYAAADARLYATFCLLGKTPQVFGQLKYWFGRAVGRPSQLIEYKGAAPPVVGVKGTTA